MKPIQDDHLIDDLIRQYPDLARAIESFPQDVDAAKRAALHVREQRTLSDPLVHPWPLINPNEIQHDPA